MRKHRTLRKNVDTVTAQMFKDSDVKSISIKKGVETFEDECFSNLKSLESVEFPQKITKLGDCLFENSKRLKSVILPENILILPDNTFKECSSLRDINLPESIWVIGKSCFESCDNLKEIRIPSNTIKIKEAAFKSCEKLYTFNCPRALNTIENYAFFECGNLMDVKLNDNLKSIGDYAFSKTSVGKILIPNSVKKLGKGAFYNTNLNSVILSNNIENIEDYCFANTKISEINIPMAANYIGNNAFENCSFLHSIKLPKNITKIGKEAFRNCSKLKEIIIENDDIVIGRMAFYNCINIEKIVYKGKEINTKNISINNLNKENLQYLYKNAENIASLKARIPFNSLMEMKKLKLDQEFFKEAYYKNYRTLWETLFAGTKNIKEEKSFFTLCYTLGVFNKELSHKSSQIILKLINEKYLNRVNISQYVESLTLKSINLNMISDFTNKQLPFFNDLVKLAKYNHPFFGLCLENYEEVQKTNISNTNGPLKPTLEKFVDYFNKDKFGVLENERDKNLAKELGKFYSKKETFYKARNILDEFEKNKTLESLISEKIREEKSLFKNCNKEFNDFKYEFLKKNDPRNFTIAKYFNGCCAHIEGKGEGICIASVLDPFTQTLVMYDKDDNAVSKAVLSINEKKQTIVINAIYIDYKYCKAKEEQLAQKYIDTLKLFIEDYNQNNDCHISRVYLGKSASALTSYFKKIEVQGFSKSINYGKYGIDKHYSGDWQKGEICIYDSKTR